MNVVVFFVNIGFYHAARLRAVSAAFKQLGWHLTAVQLTDDTLEHPWGDTEQTITFPIKTLISANESCKTTTSLQLPILQQGVIEDCLNSLSPDVVFFPGWSFQLSVKGLKWCRKKRIPAIVMSESKHDDEVRTWWKEWLKSRFYVRKFSGALVGGRIHADYVISLGIPVNNVFTGYDAVDNAHFKRCADFARENENKIRIQYPLIPKRPYFLSVLRFIPRKNVMRLLDAYIQYRNIVSNDPWDLVVCGNGDQETELYNIVRSNGIENAVHFPGFLSYNEVGYWYGLAEAFVHPALKEQWGLVVNEACAAGVPIICSKTVGARYDLVHQEKNGFLFDPENTEDIARCLVKMHMLDTKQREAMSVKSRSIVETYSPENFAVSFIKIVQSVCK